MKKRYSICFICIIIFVVCLIQYISSENTIQVESKKEVESLKFVDAHGNPYEVTINPNIAKKKFKDKNFA